MAEERRMIHGPGGPMAAFLAAPDGWPPGPAVVVIQEWWGLNPNIESIARRLAKAGFAALAPDLYHGGQSDEPDEARKLAMELDRGQALADLRAAVSWLREEGATAVGAMGFCMGGGLTWELALADDRIRAAVPFYGMAEVRGGTLRCPVQAHFGSADRFEPQLLDEVERTIEALGNGSELHRYEGAPHAFMNDTRESYRPDAAALAWQRATAFLRANLE